MTSLDDLIAYHERREAECVAEIERISGLSESKNVTNEDYDRWIDWWQKDRVIARDTVSYLKAVKKTVVGGA